MDTEAAVIIDRLLPVDSNWKVFGNNRIYNGIDYRGEEWIVLAHLVEKFDYASILHALTNLREIKRDYDQLGKEYYYSQLIILKDKASADKFMKKVKGNAKLSSMFSNVYVQNTVLYMMRVTPCPALQNGYSPHKWTHPDLPHAFQKKTDTENRDK